MGNAKHSGVLPLALDALAAPGHWTTLIDHPQDDSMTARDNLLSSGSMLLLDNACYVQLRDRHPVLPCRSSLQLPQRTVRTAVVDRQGPIMRRLLRGRISDSKSCVLGPKIPL